MIAVLKVLLITMALTYLLLWAYKRWIERDGDE